MAITLTWSELVIAAQAGMQRRILGIRNRRSEPYGTPQTDLWGNDIESAAAEFAVSKVTGLVWHLRAVSDTSTVKADVGDDIQVRWTKYEDGCLPVYKRDRDDQRYFLVTGVAPNYVVEGWLWGHEAKREDRWGSKNAGRPSTYWSTQEQLRKTLVEKVSLL